jgi:1-acyl-sn-glycerol-3-phosphate acyltransferase
LVMALAVWKLGRAPRFLAKASLFNVPVVGAALRGTGQIPVERAGSTRNHEPLKAANELVANGHCIIIYPEGTLTRDPGLWPMRGKTGAVRMALEQNIPIVPSAHWGTQKIMPRYSKKISLFPRKTIHITFGDPVDLSEFADKPLNAVTLREATEVVMAAVTKLVEDLRDETAPIERWNPTAHKQSETGHFE